MTWRSFVIKDTKKAAKFERSAILELLEKSGFKDVNASSGKIESHGFVVHEQLLNTDFEAASEFTFVGEYVLFSYRRDQLKIPSTYLKALTKAEEAVEKKNKGVQRLGRAVRDAIREKIELMLLNRAIPTIATADVVWSMKDNAFRVFSGSNAVVEGAAELFEQTFDLDLMLREPFTRLLDRGVSEDELEKQDIPEPLFMPALEAASL
jgi:hypothetical protein